MSKDGAGRGPRVRVGVLSSVIAVATALVLAGCGGSSGGSATFGGTPPSPSDASNPTNQAGADRAFLTGMVPHHAAAVAMSQVELARGSNPQVRAIAQTIMSDQQREIGGMTQIAQQQYQFTPDTVWNKPMGQTMGLPITMNMAQMGPMMQQVPQPQVDREFLMMMIPHHAGAVMMANQEQKTGTNPQLKALAASQVASQSQQIGQMQAMLNAGV